MINFKSCKVSRLLNDRFGVPEFSCIDCILRECMDIETKRENDLKVSELKCAIKDANEILRGDTMPDDDELHQIVYVLRKYGMDNTVKKICAVSLINNGYVQLGQHLNAALNTTDKYHLEET